MSLERHFSGVWHSPLLLSLVYMMLSAGELHLLPKPSCLYVLSLQVICKDWSNLAGKNYIILNMSDNVDCVSQPKEI